MGLPFTNGHGTGMLLNATTADSARTNGPWVMDSGGRGNGGFTEINEECTCRAFVRDQQLSPFVVWKDDHWDLPDESICRDEGPISNLTSDPNSDRTKAWTSEFKKSALGDTRRRWVGFVRAGPLLKRPQGACLWKGEPKPHPGMYGASHENGYEHHKSHWPCSTVIGRAKPTCAGTCPALSTNPRHKYDEAISRDEDPRSWFVKANNASLGDNDPKKSYWHTHIPLMDWVTEELTLEQATNHMNVLYQALTGINAHAVAALGNYGPDMGPQVGKKVCVQGLGFVTSETKDLAYSWAGGRYDPDPRNRDVSGWNDYREPKSTCLYSRAYEKERTRGETMCALRLARLAITQSAYASAYGSFSIFTSAIAFMLS